MFFRSGLILLVGWAAMSCPTAIVHAGEEDIPLKEARFRSYLQEANAAVEEGRYEEALAKVEKAEALTGVTPVILNLRGAVETRKENWDAAETCFEKALEQDPNFFPARFNQGELLFLRKDYEAAADHFSRMLARNPQSELLQFKLFLSYLMGGKREDAEKLLARIHHPGDSPAWFYAQSAWNFNEGNRREARKYIRSARFIFGEEKTALFDETFEDIGFAN